MSGVADWTPEERKEEQARRYSIRADKENEQYRQETINKIRNSMEYKQLRNDYRLKQIAKEILSHSTRIKHHKKGSSPLLTCLAVDDSKETLWPVLFA